MKLLTALALLLLVGCGDISSQGIKMNDSITVQNIESLIGEQLKYDVTYGDLDGDNGICFKNFNEFLGVKWDHYRYVILDIDFMNSTGTNVEMVLLHEVGHCTYGLGHTDTELLPDGCKGHIMDTLKPYEASSDMCWETHKDRYLEQVQFISKLLGKS